MDIQRLRNLTTRILHTDMSHIYQDLEFITGMDGLTTHMLPNVMLAVEPWLKLQVKDERFWDGEFDVTHTGEFEIKPINDVEQEEAKARYLDLSHPFSTMGKD